MLIAVFAPNPQLKSDPRFLRLFSELSSHKLYQIDDKGIVRDGTDMMISVGGDGTFLSASKISVRHSVPILGLNMGRMGFLSEYSVDDVVAALSGGGYETESREMLECSVDGKPSQFCLNEVVVKNSGAAMLGIDVKLDAVPLPTIWADGVIVSTSSGSTAYSLSAGGPICTPETGVLILVPVSPHNMNVRPLVIPSSTTVDITVRAREENIRLSMDNVSYLISSASSIHVTLAQFSLKRVRLSHSNFIGALKTKLFWGEDVRNEN